MELTHSVIRINILVHFLIRITLPNRCRQMSIIFRNGINFYGFFSRTRFALITFHNCSVFNVHEPGYRNNRTRLIVLFFSHKKPQNICRYFRRELLAFNVHWCQVLCAIFENDLLYKNYNTNFENLWKFLISHTRLLFFCFFFYSFC